MCLLHLCGSLLPYFIFLFFLENHWAKWEPLWGLLNSSSHESKLRLNQSRTDGSTFLRIDFISLLNFLLRSRLILEDFGTLVFFRFLGGVAALRIRSCNRWMASFRFFSWLLNDFERMVIRPLSEIRWSLISCNLLFTSSGREEVRMSNWSWTAVDTLFTCCPPGPEDRTDFIWISSKGIAIYWVILSIRVIGR